MIWRDDNLLAFAMAKIDKAPTLYVAMSGAGGAALAQVTDNPLSATATILTIILVGLKAIQEAPRAWQVIKGWLGR